jgi:PAS domain S-box-containing protein
MVEMQNQVGGLEVLLRRRDGDIRNCEVFGRFIGKTGSQLLMAVYLDVTERRQAENNMRESEERFSKAFRSSPAPMVISDIETGRFIDVNEQWLRMLGHSREETIGHTSFELGIWENPDTRVRLGRLLREQGTFRDEPVRFVSKSGIVRDTLWSAEKINLSGSEAMLSLIYDFSEKKQAEDALRESESYNKVLFHDSHIPLAVMDPATIRFVDCNNAAFAIYGLTDRSQLLGLTPGELSPPLQHDGTPSEIAAVGYISQALEQGQAVFEWQHQRPNGELWDTEVHLMVFNHRDRKLIQLSLQDITDRKKAEEEKDKLQSQLLQSQKMESVGRLAGGVAHDYNNMLGVILGHAELAMHKADERHPLYNHLNEIRNAAKRSAELTQQLLAFARRQTIAPKVHDLNASVSNTLQMLRLILGENIELVWLPGAEAYPVKIDLSQFDQLLMNLCVNARDAIEGVGRISIETERMVLDEAYCSANVFFVPGDYAVLSVSDTGCGMDRETRSKIFEPFFTTKGVGQGTGLGLATVYGIVKQNNGFINVYSEPGQGSTFRVYLPRYIGATVVEQEVEIDTLLRDNDETVLVVEDEEVLLDINTTMLLDLGYRVLSAATPSEAIRLAGEYTGRIDLLMTDVVMPEMNGRELERQVRRCHPEIECLFMSGYTANVISHHGVLDEGVHFIQKPFSLKDMAAKVRQTLEMNPEKNDGSETV